MTTNYEISWDYKNNKMKPGKYLTSEGISYNINSKGFRGKEFKTIKEKKRIIAFGGSTTIGIESPDNFTYPAQLEKILNENVESKILAGGQTLIPTMKQRLASPSTLIDISGINELKFVKDNDNSIEIGSMTTHYDVSSSDIVLNKLPSLASLAAGIGDPHVRNMGTIGGSISNNDPTACYPTACLSLRATIKTNKREISAEDFFIGLFE